MIDSQFHEYRVEQRIFDDPRWESRRMMKRRFFVRLAGFVFICGALACVYCVYMGGFSLLK